MKLWLDRVVVPEIVVVHDRDRLKILRQIIIMLLIRIILRM